MNDLTYVSAYSDSATALLNPVSTELPAGHDLSYSTLFDEIREARRADDPALSQGQWQTDIKSADWNLVRKLCENALISRSKDLQLAAWYAEAQVHLQGFVGLSIGLDAMHGLLMNYWESCHPVFNSHDFDERAGKIEWMNAQLAQALQQVPMTHIQHGAYSWLLWQESRWVENLGGRDDTAKANAIADGKLAGEIFDQAAKESGRDFYQELVQNLELSSTRLAALIDIVDTRFNGEAPSLLDLRHSLDECSVLARRLLAETSGVVIDPTSGLGQPFETDESTSGKIIVGKLHSRTQAIQSLHDVARYFRVNEPQSPVALLAERAARWAEMSMDEWLAAVIKDEGTLGQLRELLDIRSAH